MKQTITLHSNKIYKTFFPDRNEKYISELSKQKLPKEGGKCK